jgi:hypothetical protein
MSRCSASSRAFAVAASDRIAVVLCDRGTVDGAAYWPDGEAEFWAQLGTSRELELSRSMPR